MKLVYDGALFPGVGGGARHLAGMSDGLTRAGVQVIHVLPKGSAVGASEVPFETVELRWVGGRTARQFSYELSRIFLVLKWWVTGQRVDIWMARQSIFGFGLVLARLVSKTVVLEINGPIREEMEANFGSKSVARLADLLMRVQARSAHLVIAVTPALVTYTRDRVPGCRCEVVPNGADPAAAVNVAEKDRALPLLFVGALTPWYEVDVLLDAIRLLRDKGTALDCVILGDGVRRSELELQAKTLGIDDLVVFSGWVDNATVRREIQRARVGLLPLRRKHEELEAVGSPLKLYEYVASGLRVVATDLDGVVNSPVHDAVHAYHPGDPASCADAIEAALAAEGDHGLGVETWSWDSRARQLVGLVQQT